MAKLTRYALVLTSSLIAAAVLAGSPDVSGTWMVQKEGRFNPAMKLIFTRKGEFRFVGATYSSAGRYSLQGNQIRLVWTKIDNSAVKPGSIKKNLDLSPGNTFRIDQYTYAKAR